METSTRKVVAAASLVAVAVATLLLLLFLSMDVKRSNVVFSAEEVSGGGRDRNGSQPITPRKLLQKKGGGFGERKRKVVRRPAKVGAETCSNEDIVVYTDPTPPLPNGVPTYTVEIINVCSSGCAVTDVHLRCGWFASCRLVNPRLFRRLSHDDCLVNNGDPIPVGGSVTFAYANSFSYELDVTSLSCV